MKKQLQTRNLFLAVIASFLILIITSIFPDLVMARPGGGQSYSSGGSSGGGGGGGDGILIEFLILLLFEILPPEVSIPLVIVIFIVYTIITRRKKRNKKSLPSTPTFDNKANRVHEVEISINTLYQKDANFSKVLFYDFVHSLYTKFYALRGTNEFANLSPFFEKQNQSGLSKTADKITEIVIGSMKIIRVTQSDKYDNVIVEIDANYTKNNNRYMILERWLFSRKVGVISKPPEVMQTLSCPNCGAPANFTDNGQCTYCSTEIHTGEMQWFVRKQTTVRQDIMKTKNLVTYTQEVGTDAPTVYQKNLQSTTASFIKAHQLRSWDSFFETFKNNVVSPYVKELYKAWSENKWNKVRHLVSDRLYESYNFWIETYRSANLNNKLDDIAIANVETAKVEIDKFYESITVRIYASCYDYTVNAEGKVIGGSRKKIRPFTEYWTFVRRTGVEQKPKDSFDLLTCPKCGSPADKMGQTAECGYCGSKISNGEFSWVLAILTQDEVYSG